MITILCVACFTFLFTYASPVIQVKNWLENLLPKNLLFKAIFKLLKCALCFGFWFGLILFGNIFIASLISVLSELMYRFFRFFNPV